MGRFGIFCLMVWLVACGGDDTGTDFSTVVYVDREEAQCYDNGIPLSETERVLVEAGIDVIWSSCGRQSNLNYPDVCGGTAGYLNFHKVHAQNVEDAEALGFSQAGNEVIPATGEPKYELSDCPTSWGEDGE